MKPCIQINGITKRHRWKVFGKSKSKRCIYCRVPYPKKKHKRHSWVNPIKALAPLYPLVQHRKIQYCKYCGVKRFKPDKRIVNKIFPHSYHITKNDIEIIERDPIKKHLKNLGYESCK